jgi:hypothetical protein
MLSSFFFPSTGEIVSWVAPFDDQSNDALPLIIIHHLSQFQSHPTITPSTEILRHRTRKGTQERSFRGELRVRLPENKYGITDYKTM